MRAKLLLTMLAVLCLHGVSLAQGYSIRLTFNTNLRAAASLQANIIETAASGTTLNVVSELNRWLRISRNGNEVWMASWVSHTRVESNTQTQTSTQTTSNIDNCCFVDRQCSTDQEWTDGYWAFQNKQCTAPAGSQTQTSTQSTSTVSSQVDNCCFVDRQCATDQEWTDGYWAYQNNQCGAPAQTQTQTSTQPVSVDPGQANNCCDIGWQCNTDDEWVTGFYAFQSNQCKHPGIAIEGTDGFVVQVQAALDLLKNRSPHWYSYTINGLNEIRDVPEGILGVDVQARSFALPPSHAFLHGGVVIENSIMWLAGVLVHEACHVYRYEAGFPYGTEFEMFKEEVICQQIQIDALEVIDPERRFHEYLYGLINDFFGRGYQL